PLDPRSPRLQRTPSAPFFAARARPASHPLSLHDALPICATGAGPTSSRPSRGAWVMSLPCSPAPSARTSRTPSSTPPIKRGIGRDRKSTRLNSSHVKISYAVFCLNKKNYLELL